MTCRGMELESDIDEVLKATSADAASFEATLKKFLATKNCKKDTALKWALQRATNQNERNKVLKLLEEYYKSEEALI